MNADVIKDFLISLGFQVDESGAKKFDATIAATTLQAVKLGAAVEAAALSVVAFTAKIASGLDNLYWMSQRTGATVAGIQQIGFAVSQLGGTVDGARSSLESLAHFMRNNPVAEGFLNRLGVQTRDASGNMRDMASIFTGVGDKLRNMPYYRANQYAQMLGIDENTLMAMRRGVGQFSAQYTQMARAIGYNADTAAVSSNRFMTSLRSFGEMAGMARDKIGSNLAGGLSGSIDSLRKQVIDNFPKIEQAITSGVKGILWLADVIGRVVFRLIQAAGDIKEWWGSLDRATQGLIATLGGLFIAWRILNSAFMRSPIGMVTMLIGTLALLYDDYRTWKEGGKSLIDWSQWEPSINKAISAMKWIKDTLLDMTGGVGGLQNAFEVLAVFVAGSWALRMLSGIARVSKGFSPLLAAIAAVSAWDKIGKMQEEAKSQGKSVGQYLIDRMNQNQGSSGGLLGQADGLLNKAYSWWAGISGTNGATNAYDAYGTVKRPQPTKAGAALLGWMQPALQRLEKLYRLPEGLLRSVAIAESSGDPMAMSGAGAEGLFQLMPGTARDLGLRNGEAFDPMKSAQAAAKYLSQLLKSNGGDLSKALASYNWGIGNVQKHGMALLPEETRNYIPRVMSNMPSGGAQINQETNIHIHGVTDPAMAGKAVADQQTSVNSRISQALSTGPR
ncbi:lytic transglycosylase domain-containing protein [Pantoea ananatis]|uniref:lytic transglycosylase domain-containing protein n=1 Tax=Pantoea ananas TaxID=553 RepID=UPI00092039C8|nr:lytic transglycosylase domain-containing protein [Pantoea ananatis]SFX17712.1 Transglycosylase SLT domain-containing protein [Pantoea ananatis]